MNARWYEHPAAQRATDRGDHGALLRMARLAMGLTQAQAGELVGYSAAQMSRYETGATKLTDVAALRHFARAFDIPPRRLGLSDSDASLVPGTPGMVRADTEGGGRVERREFLATGLGAITGAMLPVSALADHGITSGLDELLFGPSRPAAVPVGLDQLAAMMASAARDFRACRYRRLAGALPSVIRTAEATRDGQPLEGRSVVETHISDAYALATDVLTKFHEDGAAWATTDRAIKAAHAAGDPRALARAQRLAAIVLRRSAHRDKAQTVVLESAQRFAAATGFEEPGDASFYASMLCTASYTAALSDRRSAAYDLLREARQTIDEHGVHGFGSNDIALYSIGVARALGDFGNAVAYTREVRVDLFVSEERRARYWEDAALAWWGRGRFDATFEAMLRAERAAPEEVRYRPWAQKLTTQLLASPAARQTSGLREFAARTGVG